MVAAHGNGRTHRRRPNQSGKAGWNIEFVTQTSGWLTRTASPPGAQLRVAAPKSKFFGRHVMRLPMPPLSSSAAVRANPICHDVANYPGNASAHNAKTERRGGNSKSHTRAGVKSADDQTTIKLRGRRLQWPGRA